MRLVLVSDRREEVPPRVLTPRSPLAQRAGLEPIVVPAQMWVSPSLLATMAPPRPALRIVA